MFLCRSINSHGSLRQLHTSNALRKAIIINGKKIANDIQTELKATVDNWVNESKKRPKLVAIIVGNDPASEVYIKRKIKAANFVGIENYTIRLEGNKTQQDLIKEINILNNDNTVDGILVQLPLTKHMNEQKVCQAILPSKDVDGFHLENLGSLALGRSGIVPATALAIALLLHADSKGKRDMLDMTTTICHRHTPHTELEKFTKLADLVVAAAGIPGLITKEMIKPGACVIDVGITRVKMGDGYKLVGDVDFENVQEVAGYITPVPGGVGPMTVAMLMKNTVLAAEKNLETLKHSGTFECEALLH